MLYCLNATVEGSQTTSNGYAPINLARGLGDTSFLILSPNSPSPWRWFQSVQTRTEKAQTGCEKLVDPMGR
jgi:hypothetical protein